MDMDNVNNGHRGTEDLVDKLPTELESQDIEQTAQRAAQFLRGKLYGLPVTMLAGAALFNPEPLKVVINLWGPPGA